MRRTVFPLLLVFNAAGTCLVSCCSLEHLPIRGIHVETHRLMGESYEVRRCNGINCHAIHTKFHKVWFVCSRTKDMELVSWFRHSKVNGGESQAQKA
jgi:hypothetical protein